MVKCEKCKTKKATAFWNTEDVCDRCYRILRWKSRADKYKLKAIN